MATALQSFVLMPVPLWVFILLLAVVFLRDRETRKWIMRIAQTVDKMDSDEKGWCRHDPVSFPSTDPEAATHSLLAQLTEETGREK